jgi:outer membrane protein, heavy metal efflux system
MKFRNVVPVLGIASLALAGCVAVPADRGSARVHSLVDSTALTEKPVSTPIGPDEAVQLALLNSPVMRQLYAELGLAQAEVYDATRLSNPSLGYLQLSPGDAGGAQKNWSLTQNFTELLFIRYRTRVGKADLLRAQQRVAHDVALLEADVRTAYYHYIGAKLIAVARLEAATAANLSAELAERFHAAGNISALQLSREQAAAGAATIAQRQAQSATTAAHGALFTAMGLPLNRADLKFLENLPPPTVITASVADLQTQAQRQRLDLQALRTEAGLRRDQLVHSRRWRWLGGLTVTAEREKERDGEVIRGGGAAVDLPIFNAGRGLLLRAQSLQESAEAVLAMQELKIANEIAVQLAAVEAARMTVDDYRQRLVPLVERIVLLSQQQQNYMLIGAFDVLAAKREEVSTRENYIAALRDYWISHTRLYSEIGGVK